MGEDFNVEIEERHHRRKLDALLMVFFYLSKILSRIPQGNSNKRHRAREMLSKSVI